MTWFSGNELMMLIKFGRVNGNIVLSHLLKNVSVDLSRNLNGRISRVNKTDSSSDALGHIYAIICDFVHEKTPFAYSKIVVIVHTHESAYNLITVNLSKGNLWVLVDVFGVLEVDSYNSVFDHSEFLELIHDRGWCICWGKSYDTNCIKFTKNLITNNEV